MKRYLWVLAPLLVAAGVALAQNVANYVEQGGARTVIGGELDIVSGGTLRIAGDEITGIGITGTTTLAADELAVPVTDAVVVKTTGGDAEALTLADGTPGQILTIVLGTDGTGDGTLTPDTATGWATIVFADAGDTATLRFVDATVGWVIVGTAGVAAPPAISV